MVPFFCDVHEQNQLVVFVFAHNIEMKNHVETVLIRVSVRFALNNEKMRDVLHIFSKNFCNHYDFQN